MINQNEVYTSHSLYNQFTKWAGLDGSIDDNYFMINASLFAAETYMDSRYSIILQAKEFNEKLPLNSLSSRLKHFPSNLLSIFKSNTLSLPTVDYFNTTTSGFVSSIGDYTITDNVATFERPQSTTRVNYVAGYIVKDTVDYTESGNTPTNDGTPPDKPRVVLTDGSKIQTPYLTKAFTLVVDIYGEAGARIIINEEEIGDAVTADSGELVRSDGGDIITSGGIIGLDGHSQATLNIDKEFNSYRIALMDSSGNVSEMIKFLIIRTEQTVSPKVVVVATDLVTNGHDITCNVYLNKEVELLLDTVSLGTYQQGLHTLALPCPTVDGTSFYQLQAVSGTTKSKTSIIPISYSATYDDGYLEDVNVPRLDIPYMPSDLLVAFFKLAHHSYHSTLYKDDNIDRYSAGLSKSVSFSSHKIPSDVIETLHRYTTY